MSEVIDSFRGEFDFLSNFSNHGVIVFGRLWKTAEHAYQAAKTNDPNERAWIAMQETPGKAKKAGSKKGLNGDKITLIDGWDDVKVDIMRIIVRRKFKLNNAIRTKLIATGDAELIEGNWWHDEFWGVCNGRGENHLGRILMELREEFRNA